MNSNSIHKIIIFCFLLWITVISCKKPVYKTFEDVLPLQQWRKTSETVYNKNNEFEKYTFNFETAEDCQKNSFLKFGNKYNDTYGDCIIQNFCSNRLWISYRWSIKNDSLIFTPYDFDTLQVKFSRFIDYYNMRTFTLRHDTLINDTDKIIKETYSAFD